MQKVDLICYDGFLSKPFDKLVVIIEACVAPLLPRQSQNLIKLL